MLSAPFGELRTHVLSKNVAMLWCLLSYVFVQYHIRLPRRVVWWFLSIVHWSLYVGVCILWSWCMMCYFTKLSESYKHKAIYRGEDTGQPQCNPRAWPYTCNIVERMRMCCCEQVTYCTKDMWSLHWTQRSLRLSVPSRKFFIRPLTISSIEMSSELEAQVGATLLVLVVVRNVSP